MNTKRLLFKLRLCHGIGIHGEHRVWQWLNHFPEQLITTYLSVQQIIRIAKIPFRYQSLFQSDYNSLGLKQRMQLNNREHWISILDSNYPLYLKEANFPHNVLFYRGNINLLKGPLLGVVGARNHSRYAVNAVYKLLPSVVRRGIAVVAGLAAGVDSLGHRCAIVNHGSTIAVIGTGLDQYYPRYNYRLQDYIAKHQLLVTEYPLGTGVRRFHFPSRNRIIAGLVHTIVIVEARRRSGSLITANLALQDNRNVTAVPGRIDQPLSEGCNRLIASGAKPICCSQDILEEFFNLTR